MKMFIDGRVVFPPVVATSKNGNLYGKMTVQQKKEVFEILISDDNLGLVQKLKAGEPVEIIVNKSGKGEDVSYWLVRLQSKGTEKTAVQKVNLHLTRIADSKSLREKQIKQAESGVVTVDRKEEGGFLRYDIGIDYAVWVDTHYEDRIEYLMDKLGANYVTQELRGRLGDTQVLRGHITPGFSASYKQACESMFKLCGSKSEQ